MGTISAVKTLCAGAMLTLALLGGSVGVRAESSSSLIQPGVGVGSIKLGQSVEEVVRGLGGRKADAAWETGSGEAREVSLAYHALGLTLVFDNGKKLVRIIVRSPGLLAERTWVRVGSSVKDVLGQYGTGAHEEKSPEANAKGFVLDYKELGVAFQVDPAKNRVEEIRVMEVRP